MGNVSHVMPVDDVQTLYHSEYFFNNFHRFSYEFFIQVLYAVDVAQTLLERPTIGRYCSSSESFSFFFFHLEFMNEIV